MKHFIQNKLRTIAAFTALLLFANTNANAQCQSGFTHSINGQTVTFTNTSTGTNVNTLYYWNFGDNSYGYNQNEVHTYQYGGTYFTCLQIMDSMNNCYSNFCDSFTVVGPPPPCSAAFVASTNNTLMAYFNSTSTGVTVNTQYSWSFGDNTSATGQNVSHLYSNNGSYNVCLYISDNSTGCSDYTCQQIYVGTWTSSCAAAFTYVDNNGTVTFTNTSTGMNNQTGYMWDFGDNTPYGWNLNEVHTYQYAGTYTVCLTIWDSINTCQSTYCDTVTVGGNPQPCNAYFSMYPDSNNQYNYWAYNLSTGQNPMSYDWNWGDNTPDDYTAYPSHTYNSPGLYNICLTITAGNGCSSTYCTSLQVFRMSSSSQSMPVTINVINPNPSAIHEQNKTTEFSVYPNPVTDFIRVSGKDLDNATFSIYDILGNSVANGALQNNSISVNELAKGVYILKVNVNGTIGTKRFVKE